MVVFTTQLSNHVQKVKFTDFSIGPGVIESKHIFCYLYEIGEFTYFTLSKSSDIISISDTRLYFDFGRVSSDYESETFKPHYIIGRNIKYYDYDEFVFTPSSEWDDIVQVLIKLNGPLLSSIYQGGNPDYELIYPSALIIK